jgi:AsmA family
MKPLRILAVLFALAVIACAAVYFNLNRIVKNEIEKQGTASLRLATTLDAARLSIFGGKVGLHGLAIASPKGFATPHMLELSDLDVAVKYAELRGQPIHVASIILNKPKLIVEQSNGVFNFKKASELQPASPPDEKPMQLVIDEVKVQDAQVVLRPGLPGVPAEMVVPVPSLTMKDVGKGKGSNNGAALHEVAMQIMSALAAKAAQSDQLPAELKALMHLNAGQVSGMLGAEAQKALSNPGQALQGFLGAQKPAGRAPPPAKR